METARLGRLRLGRCVGRDLGYLGCSADALAVVDSLCTGQFTCELSVMDSKLRDLRPCPNDVTWHLEATFSCVDGTID